jgi:hypothetical protein
MQDLVTLLRTLDQGHIKRAGEDMNRTSMPLTPEAQPTGPTEGHSLSASFFAEGDRLDAEGRGVVEGRRGRRRALTRAVLVLALALGVALWLMR